MTTLNELIDLYIAEILPRKRPNSQVSQRQQLLFWKKYLDDKDVANIKPIDIIKGRATIEGSDSTKNCYTAALSHVFTIAMKEWDMINENPCLKISKLKNARGRVRYLNDQERRNLLDACEESSSRYLYLVVLLALTTGARKMEIMNLRWENVDLDKELIYLHETKNGEMRLLTIVPMVRKLLLKHMQESKTALLFPSRRDKENPIDMMKPFQAALKRAGIADFHFHDLRHTFASYLAMNGTSTLDMADLLGHKSLNMVKRYAHLSTAHKSSVVNSMTDKIFKE